MDRFDSFGTADVNDMEPATGLTRQIADEADGLEFRFDGAGSKVVAHGLSAFFADLPDMTLDGFGGFGVDGDG